MSNPQDLTRTKYQDEDDNIVDVALTPFRCHNCESVFFVPRNVECLPAWCCYCKSKFNSRTFLDATGKRVSRFDVVYKNSRVNE